MQTRNITLSRAIRTALTGGLLLTGLTSTAFADNSLVFNPGDLVVTSSQYDGTANAIVPGTTNLAGANATSTVKAIGDSSFANVFNNNTVDGSFGVTSPIFISNVNPSNGNIDSTVNLTQIAANQGINLVTSFSSKSELAINPSTNGGSYTLNGYGTTIGQLDISNSNTPGVTDPTNPTLSINTPATYRDVAQINTDGTLTVTNTNAYSGNNGRATILNNDNGNYLMVGNAGNSGKPAPSNTVLSTLSDNTGVQSIAVGSNNGTLTANDPSANSTVIGAVQGTTGSATGYQHGFSVTETNPLTNAAYGPADKTGKDDNFRGETVFNNTLYVTKGSGGNGIDTVYQVGATGGVDSLNANSPITVLPGLPAILASATGVNHFPFGIWFANANTLYVADEGAGGTIDTIGTKTGVGGATGAAATDTNAGLEKWVLEADGQWHNVYTMQAGLNLGISYTVSGTTQLTNETGSWTAATDGLRALTGHVNADGTVTLYATTSTISDAGDQGADPNKLVAITDTVGALALGTQQFTTLQTAQYGQVLRGVAIAAPVPLPPSMLMMLGGLGLTGLMARRNKRA